MTIRIVADSTCDIPENLARTHGIAIIPTCINIGSNTYLDGIDMTREQFYQSLPDFPSVIRTSSPGPEAFVRTYEHLADEGADEIISIHPPARMSNLFNVAQLAASSVTRVKVIPLDLGQVSLGTGLLVLKGAIAAKKGDRLEAIIQMLLDCTARTHTYAALETLEYLKRSGRIPSLIASIGSLLSLKPVVSLTKGVISIGKARTSRSATRYIIRQIKSLGALEQVAFMHTHARKRADEFMLSLNNMVPIGKDTLLVEATPILGAHVGLGVVGMVAITK